MRYLLLLLTLLFCTRAALGQVVNPTVIHQDTDIALHFTDVYYYPFAPPSDSDTRAQLSCIASELRDPNGVRENYPYSPMTHGVPLSSFRACDTCPQLGDTVVWQRLFTAENKPDGSPSDIIAGGEPHDSVVISKNEDVDFRATGIIELKNGFHAKPGCFFHAYIAPKWDSVVFSDEFSNTAKFHNQWFIPNNTFDANTDVGADCSYDSNVTIVPDSEAEDGWALRIDLKENPDTCHCLDKSWVQNGCYEDTGSSTIKNYPFSTETLMSCPWPFIDSAGLLRPAYDEAPYGRYEIREKVPIIYHHTNNWGDGQSDEWNLDEKTNDGVNGRLDQIHPGPTHRFIYGPFNGRFTMRGTAPEFVCGSANFATWNDPLLIVINNFAYQVQLQDSVADTSLTPTGTTASEGGFPYSLTSDTTDSLTFYYTRQTSETSDPLAWSVDTSGRYFTGPFGIDRNGDTLYFNKDYQPVRIFLLDSNMHPRSTIGYGCRWDADSQKIYLNDPMGDSASHRGVGFSYETDEGTDYPVPAVEIDTSSYTYHTYTMEFLPSEVRILLDGAVVRRFPDRMIPSGDPRYDWIWTFPRTPMSIRPGEIDIDGNPDNPSDTGAYYQEKRYFEAHDTTCHGCWPVDGVPSAHHMLDYVKIWQLPSDMLVPKFPQ